MARRGRPRSERAASAQLVYIRLRLYPDEDDDVIEFFASIPPGLWTTVVNHVLRSVGAPAHAEDIVDDEDVVGALSRIHLVLPPRID